MKKTGCFVVMNTAGGIAPIVKFVKSYKEGKRLLKQLGISSSQYAGGITSANITCFYNNETLPIQPGEQFRLNTLGKPERITIPKGYPES